MSKYEGLYVKHNPPETNFKAIRTPLKDGFTIDPNDPLKVIKKSKSNLQYIKYTWWRSIKNIIKRLIP